MLWFGAIVIGAALGAILWMKTLRRRAADMQREKDVKLESEAPQSAMLRKNFEPASRWLLKPMETFPKDAAANLRTNFPGRIAFVPSSITAKLIANVAPLGLLEPEEVGNTFNWVELFSICMPLYLLGNYAIRGITTLATGAPLGFLGVFNLIIFLIWIPFVLVAIFWIVSLLGERFALLKTTRGIVRAGPGVGRSSRWRPLDRRRFRTRHPGRVARENALIFSDSSWSNKCVHNSNWQREEPCLHQSLAKVDDAFATNRLVHSA